MKNLKVVACLVSKDNPDDVSKTIKSLIYLDKYLSRIIVVDSSKTDTVKKLTKDVNLDTIYIWETPKGIYSAMNTALNCCENDEYIWYLNPGDILIDPKTFRSLLKLIEETLSVWGFGQARKIIGNRLEIFPKKNSHFSSREIASGSFSISHQAMIVNVEALKDLGGFNEKLKVASDLFTQVKLAQEFYPSFLNIPIVEIDPTGLSHKNIFTTIYETAQVRYTTGEFSLLETIFAYFKTLINKIARRLFS